MFNGQRNLMKLSRFPAFWFVTVLAMGICISTAQTNGPAPQNVPRAAPGNGVRGSNVRPNNSNAPHILRDRLTLANAHPARSRIKCKISNPRIFDLLIRGFPGNWVLG